MKKCIFVLPHFGKFKNYFPLFLKSCEKNPEFSWLLVTDNTQPYTYPDNVKVVKMTFDEMQRKIQERFKFPISLDHPYKLCDYKPAYGYIFEDMIREYEWWGHCDSDVILGNLSEILPPLFAEKYDKIFAAGHMTIYRNTQENNRRFMKTENGNSWFRRAFTTPGICWFDEDYWTETYKNENVHHIFLRDHAKVYQTDRCFGVLQFRTQFCRAKYAEGTGRFPVQPYEKALFVWDDGALKRIVKEENGDLRTESLLYIHLQGRTMRYKEAVGASSLIQIYPNGFRSLNKLPESRREWERLARYSPNLQLVRKKWNNIKLRLSKRG